MGPLSPAVYITQYTAPSSGKGSPFAVLPARRLKKALLEHPYFRVRNNLETESPNWKLTQMDVGHDIIERLVSPPPPRVACPAQAQVHPFDGLHYKGHSLPRGRQLSYSPYEPQ